MPSDILRRVLDPGKGLDGTQPEDYGLPKGERLNEVITQSWSRLLKHWAEFSNASENLPDNESGTGLTNDKWSLPLLRELGFGLLPTSPGPEIEGRTYAINRFFGPVPIHLIGCGLSLDRRTAGARGAAIVNPHGLVQEYLNRSDDHLWAIVSNGLRLRVLRDNLAMSRQSFLEFDLESMFSGEVYSDFVLLWLTAHATRFSPVEGERPNTCRLEKWTKLAEEQGTRALGDLRGGVERALQILGEGFTSHPKNSDLRDALRDGQVSLFDFHGQLLRVIYRLIFLFVAEDRTIEGTSLLHPIDTSEAGKKARECYATYYSTARLREVASKIKGSRHGDLWRQFQVLLGALSGEDDYSEVRKHLGLPILGSFLWDPNYTTVLNEADLTNYDFLEILRNLCFTRQDNVLRPVDYKNLGAEELGGVYESLLSLTPQISSDGARFSFAEFAGSERKTSGSYYTPDSLVQCLLDSALDPVVEDAIRGKVGDEAEKAILNLKVCDPAVGSGHFLVGAAHRLARHLSRVRSLAQGESEPSPLLYQQALRDVIGRCLYGVDINPMSAELCRVSLWLEALEPGKPLSFLDHHIRVGNSLIGATPELIAGGLPDDVFKAIEGDDTRACTFLRKRNRSEREGLGPLFKQQEAQTQTLLAEAASTLELLPDHRPEDIRAKELAFRRHEKTDEYFHKKQLADAWCAAFVIRKFFLESGRNNSVCGITQSHLNELAESNTLPANLQEEVSRISGLYQFFHWHLAFPEVFAIGGFDCILGNPPWEQIEFDARQFFSSSVPEIASAKHKAERDRLIAALEHKDPSNYKSYLFALSMLEATKKFFHESGAYPLTSIGRLNYAPLFVELSKSLTRDVGRCGLVTPSGILADSYNQEFSKDLINKNRLVSFYDFENRRQIFTNVQGNMKFCLITIGTNFTGSIVSGCQLDDPELIKINQRLYRIKTSDVQNTNPNTENFPMFSSARDANLVLGLYRRNPVIWNEREPDGNYWAGRALIMYMSNSSSGLFKTKENLEHDGWTLEGNRFYRDESVAIPFFEAKLIGQFNHRAATYEGIDVQRRFNTHAGTNRTSSDQLLSPAYQPLPRYWIFDVEFQKSLGASHMYYLGYRKIISAVADSRSMVACILPQMAVSDSFPLFLSGLPANLTGCLCACLNSFCLDYNLRQKASGANLNLYIFKQLASPLPATYNNPCLWGNGEQAMNDWILPYVLELTFTAWDLESFARECGYVGPPFHWDEDRRFLLRCELDAAFFHLYLPAESNGNWHRAEGETDNELESLKANFPTPRSAVDYIMESFPIIRNKDIKKYGDYRTKLVILKIYDQMQEAMETGIPYQTLLDPPPADPSISHSN